MTDRTTLLSYSEDVDISAELQSVANQLSESMNLTSIAVTINQSEEENDRLSRVVKDELIFVTARDYNYVTPELAFQILKKIVDEKKPRLIIIGSTRDGKEVAGMLASYLDCGVASDCSSVTFDSNRILIQRAAFGGRVTASAELTGESAVIAVRPHVYRPPEPKFTPSVKRQEYQDITLSVVVESVARKVTSTTDLTKAERIVSVGRGLKRKDDLALIQKLADELSAAIGCSRPLAADLGWLPEETHIGLTGVQVKPKLYVAIGISGQLQHLAGIKDSELIVAINTDKSAPIFQNCDYGIIGDLYQVIPELTKAITQLKNKK